MLIDKTSIQATATVLFGVLGATMSVLTWKGNHDAYCISSVRTFVEVSRRAYLSLPSDHYTNPLMKRIVDDCGYKSGELLQLMGSHPDDVARIDLHRQSGAQREKAEKNLQKWVLLGASGGRSNFSVQGKAGVSQWQEGDQLTALEDVNVRSRFANWSTPQDVIVTGEVVTLADAPFEAPDGDKTQYWGRLR